MSTVSPDYIRDELRFVHECYALITPIAPQTTRNDFMQYFAASPFAPQYRDYWKGLRHRPKQEEVARSFLEALLCH